MYGKLMSISDELMWSYWLLLTDRGEDEIAALKAATARGDRHPMEVKKELARAIVGEFHGAAAATEAEQEFSRVFSSRDLPTEVPELCVEATGETMLLSKLLVSAGLGSSNSEARRLMEQGAQVTVTARPGEARLREAPLLIHGQAPLAPRPLFRFSGFLAPARPRRLVTAKAEHGSRKPGRLVTAG
jgi:tyrosyl-tRNA synthetase